MEPCTAWHYLKMKEHVMKKATLVISTFALAATLSFGAQAADEATTPTTPTTETMTPTTEDNPCQKIEMACKEGGFILGGAETGKGLVKHCMEPLMAGKTVEGVKVEAADVTACQEKGKMLKTH
jgi:hypothetical protein